MAHTTLLEISCTGSFGTEFVVDGLDEKSYRPNIFGIKYK